MVALLMGERMRFACACVAAAIISTPPASSQDGASALPADAAAFDKLAAELVDELDRNKVLASTPRIGVWPFEEYPVLDEHARRYEGMISDALGDVSRGRFIMVTHELDPLVRQLQEAPGDKANPIANLDVQSAVDLLLIGDLQKVDESLEVRYRVQSLENANVLAQATTRIPLPESRRQGRQWETALSAAADQFRQELPNLTGVRIRGVGYQSTGAITELGNFLAQQFRTELSRAFNNELTDRNIQTFSGDEELSPGVYTLSGHYWDYGDSILLQLVLRGADRRESSWGGYIGSDSLPPTLNVGGVGEFGPIARNLGGQVGLQIESRLPSYRIGETLDLRVTLDRPAWLYCYYLQSHDKILVRMFPNEHHPDAALHGPRTYAIPGQIFPFEFNVQEPPGVDLIKCFAAPRDITDDLTPDARGENGEQLPRNARFQLHKDFRSIGAGVTEATLTVTTLP